MTTPLWIQYLLAIVSGFLLCLVLMQLQRARRTPLHNTPLLQFLQQQSNAYWLTDPQAIPLWHNHATRHPAANTRLAQQLFFSAEGLDPGLPDILAMLQISPHWQGQVWIGSSDRQAYQLNVRVLSGYRQRFLLWHWKPLQAALEQAQAQIRAYADPVTKLPSATLWHYWLQSQLHRHQAKYHSLAVLLLEMNDYPAIVRNFGQTAADGLLQQLVNNVQAEIPASAFMARLAPHQLALLLSLDGHAEQAEQQAIQLSREILQFCQGPFFIPQAELRLDCRAGIAIFPEAGHDADELQAHAAHALHIAATLPERMHLWQMQGKNPAPGLQLQYELQQALTQYQCEIWSQPVIELATGIATAFRLELYWRSPQRGLLSYAELKPLAEQSGQLLALERWAFCQICQLAELWQRLGPLPPLQVELSAANFRHCGLLNFLQSQLEDHQLLANQFVLCLREDGWLQDPAGFSKQAEELKAAGFGLMIVEVGDGLSSLQLLQQPFWQAAELSAAMIKQLEESETQRNACASLIRLLVHLGLKVCTQGTDREMQAYLLHVMGGYGCRGAHFSTMRLVDGRQQPYGGQQQWRMAG